jgi:hypothetical protein
MFSWRPSKYTSLQLPSVRRAAHDTNTRTAVVFPFASVQVSLSVVRMAPTSFVIACALIVSYRMVTARMDRNEPGHGPKSCGRREWQLEALCNIAAANC